MGFIKTKFLFSNDKSDVIYLTILQGVNYIIPIAIMPYLMINLDAKAYGYLGFAQAVIQYFLLFIDFGFNLSATKRIAIHKDDKETVSRIFYSTLYAKLFFLLISTIIFCLLFCIPKFYEYRIALLCTFPTIIGSTFTFIWLYQGIGKIRLISFFSIASRVLLLPLIFFYVKTPDDYPLAIFIQSCVYVLTAIISIYWLIKSNIFIRVKVSVQDMFFEIKESYHLFLSSASISIYTQLFTVILGITTTAEVVGRYSAAERIMRALCFLFYTPISQVYFPKVANLAVKKRQEAIVLFKSILKFTNIIMLIVSLVLFFTGSYLEKVFGKNYLGIGVLLKILAFTPLAIASGAILGQMGLIALGNNDTKKDFQRSYFIAAPFSLIVVLILSYYFAEYGAAISVFCTELIVALLMFYYVRRNKILSYRQ